MKKNSTFENEQMVFYAKDSVCVVKQGLGYGESGEGYLVTTSRSHQQVMKVIHKSISETSLQDKAKLEKEAENNFTLYGQGELIEVKMGSNEKHYALMLKEMLGENYPDWLQKEGNAVEPDKILQQMQQMLAFTIDALEKDIILTDLSFNNWKIDVEKDTLQIFDLGNPYQDFSVQDQLRVQIQSLLSQFSLYSLPILEVPALGDYKESIEVLGLTLLSLANNDYREDAEESKQIDFLEAKLDEYKAAYEKEGKDDVRQQIFEDNPIDLLTSELARYHDQEKNWTTLKSEQIDCYKQLSKDCQHLITKMQENTIEHKEIQAETKHPIWTAFKKFLSHVKGKMASFQEKSTLKKTTYSLPLLHQLNKGKSAVSSKSLSKPPCSSNSSSLNGSSTTSIKEAKQEPDTSNSSQSGP